MTQRIWPPITVDGYDRLSELAVKFAQRQLPFLIIEGRPGTGKTRTFKQALEASGQGFGFANSRMTARGMYEWAYRHRDQPLLIDDVDEVADDTKVVSLLKAVCNTDDEKLLTWTVAGGSLGKNLPETFVTRSPVCIVANDIKANRRGLAAVLDRALYYCFDPSADELHAKAGDFVTDQQVYDFVGRHVHLATSPSLRDYVHAGLCKLAGEDWQRTAHARLFGERHPTAGLYLVDGLPTVGARIKAFKEQGYGSRAAYYRWLKRMQDGQVVKRVCATRRLTHSPQPLADEPELRLAA